MSRPPFFSGFEFDIPDIRYSFDGRGSTCPMMQFLCAEFGKTDNPDPLYPQLPFTVEGVWGEEDLTPAPEHLIVCAPFPSCDGMNYVCLLFYI